MENLYLFEKEQYFPKKKIVYSVMGSVVFILFTLMIPLVFIYFNEALLGLILLFVPLLPIYGLYKIFRVLCEKCYTVQMEPGGIKFTDDQEKIRFVPATNIRKIKQVDRMVLSKDKKENVSMWLIIYSIELCSRQRSKEIRFKEYREDGRDFRFELKEGMIERSEKFMEQVNSLDRSEEFIDYIGLKKNDFGLYDS